jgi:DNA helicase-2/ATP-dependent DNA helicase PcrA
MVLHSRSELEEERRLFYVALTRAEQTCTISYAVSRFVFGNLQSSEPSRFISEISKEFITYENPYGDRAGGRSLNARPGMNEKPYIGGLNRMPTQPSNLRSISDLGASKGKGSSALELKVGYNVVHERFGKGKVMKIEGTGDDKKATIFFPKEGSKTLLMKFAKLEVVD